MVKEYTDIYEYTKRITLELVKTPSMVRNGNDENNCAEKLQDLLMEIPYFQEHPDHVMFIPLEKDSLNRKNVFAFVEGNGQSTDTVVLLSHYDTVGVGDYGDLADFAFDPAKLKVKMREKIATNAYDEDVVKDLQSEDWLFGRGVVDMKSGVAENLCVLKLMTEELASLKGNVLFISAPDEEALALGAQSAARKVCELRDQKKLNFVGLIKTDAMLPRYPDDPNNYVYLGTIGKYLLSFYICGVASHAGESLEGLDSNLIASSLVKRISLNTEFCDEADGEITPPPVSLKQTDFKEVYDVQIPYESQVYFNYFTFTRPPSEVLTVGKQVATQVMEEINQHFVAQKRIFNQKAGVPYDPVPFKPNIFTFEEIYAKVTGEKPHLAAELAEFAKNYTYHEADATKLSLAIVRKLFMESNEFHEKNPCIIVYLAPPYVPRVHVREKEVDKDRFFVEALNKAIADDNNNITIRKFYPYLSDISWFGMSDELNDILDLKANTPGFERTCGVDLEPLTTLNIPSVNIGPYGKDPHQATERLYMPYAFDYVPELIYRTVKNLVSPVK